MNLGSKKIIYVVSSVRPSIHEFFNPEFLERSCQLKLIFFFRSAFLKNGCTILRSTTPG